MIGLSFVISSLLVVNCSLLHLLINLQLKVFVVHLDQLSLMEFIIGPFSFDVCSFIHLFQKFLVVERFSGISLALADECVFLMLP